MAKKGRWVAKKGRLVAKSSLVVDAWGAVAGEAVAGEACFVL